MRANGAPASKLAFVTVKSTRRTYGGHSGGVARLAGLNEHEWTPRERRHSFVSLLSDSGMSLEKIADLVGHSGTSVTEKVYRHQLPRSAGRSAKDGQDVRGQGRI
jgi:integrase